MFSWWQPLRRYTQIPSGIEEVATIEDSSLEKSAHTHPSHRLLTILYRFPDQAVLGGFVVIILLAGAAGFALGALIFREQEQPDLKRDTVPQSTPTCLQLRMTTVDTDILVPIGHSVARFQYNATFANPPPAKGSPEPVWDSLIPSTPKYLTIGKILS